MKMGPRERELRAQREAAFEYNRHGPYGELPDSLLKPVTRGPASTKPVTCRCGAVLPKPKRGPRPEFCSPACKQKAYRQRKAGLCWCGCTCGHAAGSHHQRAGQHRECRYCDCLTYKCQAQCRA